MHACVCMCARSVLELQVFIYCCWSGRCGEAGGAPRKIQLFPSVDGGGSVCVCELEQDSREQAGEEEGNFLKVLIYKRAFILNRERGIGGVIHWIS